MLLVRPTCDTQGGIELSFTRVAKRYRLPDVGGGRFTPVTTDPLVGIPSDLSFLDATLSSDCATSGDRIAGGYSCRLPGTCD